MKNLWQTTDPREHFNNLHAKVDVKELWGVLFDTPQSGTDRPMYNLGAGQGWPKGWHWTTAPQAQT